MIFIFFGGGGDFAGDILFGAGGMVNGSEDDTDADDSPLLMIASIIADTLGFDTGFVMSGNGEQV